MIEPVDGWLRESLDLLANFQFTARGCGMLRNAPIALLPADALAGTRGEGIAIAIDVETPLEPSSPWNVPFGRTHLRLWNPLPSPGSGWSAFPQASSPLWWRHESGALTPAWNLWGNLKDLLTFREEREISARDAHGRFAASFSPRAAHGLLGVPAVNDANAALLDAAAALAHGTAPRGSLDRELVNPPGVALSHDCDQLRGNDPYTQSIRLLRAGRSAAAGRLLQASRHLRGVVENAMFPRRYFVGNLHGMFDVERQFGFRSVCYFLTGASGRFGARSGNAAAQSFIRQLPHGWEAGVHYNYGTVGDDARLRREIDIVATATGVPVVCGRAHYLKFDPTKDFGFLERNGIQYDETVGWPDRLDYRAGIAGPFRPYDEARRDAWRVIEMPLVCMDFAMAASPRTVQARLAHLREVGGLLSVLIHPGEFFNPESPEYSGLYERVLADIFVDGGRGWTPLQVLATAAGHVSKAA